MQNERERLTRRFPLMLSPSMADALEREAVERETSVAAVVREAVRDRIARHTAVAAERWAAGDERGALRRARLAAALAEADADD